MPNKKKKIDMNFMIRIKTINDTNRIEDPKEMRAVIEAFFFSDSFA